MSALDLSDIPSNINTYERLFVWAGQCLQSIGNGDQTNVLANTPAEQTAQVQTAVVADGTNRFIVTGYVPLDQDALNDANNKTWMAAKDIGEADLRYTTAIEMRQILGMSIHVATPGFALSGL